MDMPAKDVFSTRPDYAEHDPSYKKFYSRLSSLKKQVMRPPKPPKRIKWAKSEARQLLETDLRTGTTPMDMDPEDVFLSRPEFAEYNPDFDLFKNRLSSLIEQCQEKDDRAALDSDAFEHDRAIYPFPLLNFCGEPQWPGSSAEEWLSSDIDDGRHLEMAPKDLYESRGAYQEFQLKTFRGHIYQMIKSRKFLTYMRSRDRLRNR